MDSVESTSKENAKDKEPVNLCIEIGSSRVKIGVQNTTTQEFKFIYKETSFFFFPLEELFQKLSNVLEENGVEIINKIGISTTGDVDIEKGTIQSCGTLKIIAKQKHFKDFQLVNLINSQLKQKILDKEFTYLINDGHSAGLGVYHFAKKTHHFPYVVLSLGTFPAISVITESQIATIDSRKNFIGGKHLSQYCAKAIVVRDGKTDLEYTNNILQIIPLLKEICLSMTGEEMTHLFILGGMSNHITDKDFFKDEETKNIATIIRDDHIIYSQIIFPGLLKSNPNIDTSIKLVFKETFSVKID